MWMIVGLGNPGARYLMTRHNVGFMLIDHLILSLKDPGPRDEMRSRTFRFRWDEEGVLLVQPQTFMNLSGESVRALKDYYKIELDRIVVIHDEIEIPFGELRIQKNRGPGGHNGLKSINQHLGTQDYLRIRIGVGRPPSHEKNKDVATWVLENFSASELQELPNILTRTGDALETLIFEGWSKAATQFNSSRKEA